MADTARRLRPIADRMQAAELEPSHITAQQQIGEPLPRFLRQ
jgi:hypothetical protein